MNKNINEPEVTLELALLHGLNEEEYEKIFQVLGRKPNYTELGIFSVMWSEHCSYKNSIALIKTLPRTGKRLLVGAGEENAGLVDIGDGLAIAFKIESHNHPSAVEPYQGAATGVGGILRDIFTMGARPIAALNSLRFGNPQDPRVQYLIKGITKGIGDYGNCFGVPTVAGEVYFEDCYTENPIVNAMAVGIVKHNEVAKAVAKGAGNLVMIVGSATGRDGIHGATFASQEISEESEGKRSSVQVGDPFTEKLLLEATLETIRSGYLIGIQDMGAAGITCSTSEMSAKGKSGMLINLDKVPTRESGMSAYEIMLSESQERMLVIVKKGFEKKTQDIFEKWDLHGVIVGEITSTPNLKIFKGNEVVADIPAESLVLGGGAPVYRREIKIPDYIKQIRTLDITNIKEPEDYDSCLLKLLTCPNIASKNWIFRQYDSMVRTNTMSSGISDSAVIRIKDTNKAIAVTTDGNSRYVYLNPRIGAEIAVAESARNVVCSGATPIAITNCLNFGNPYNPETYWQFKEAIDGISNACKIFDTPVTGGNVSFYNESPNYTVYPSPVIGMLGLIESLEHITTMEFKSVGDLIVLLGKVSSNLAGSEYLKLFYGVNGPDAPFIDLDYEHRVQKACLSAIKSGIINSAHDVSDGGLAVCIAECCIASGLGADIKLDEIETLDKLLFGEDQSRIVVTVGKNKFTDLKEIALNHQIDLIVLGEVISENLKINTVINFSVVKMKERYQNSLAKIIEGEKND